MKALVLAPFDPQALETLRQLVPTVYESWLDTRRLYAPEELADRVNSEDVGILVVEADFLYEEFFQQSRSVKLVAVCRNSLDHVDLAAATSSCVPVVHTPGRNARAVAELTLGLMLALARRIPYAHCYVASGRWQDPVEPYVSLRGQELQGKTLGIIGLGRIGRQVARLGRAIGMQVLASDPYAGAPCSRKGPALLTPLDALLSGSDFITLHVPQNVELILDRNRLSQAKPGAFLINTSTSAALDLEALAHALKSGHIAGAALDVHEAQPIPPSNPLLGLDNVILTPHIGGATVETVQRYSWAVVEDIRRFFSGRRPRGLANKVVWRRRG